LTGSNSSSSARSDPSPGDTPAAANQRSEPTGRFSPEGKRSFKWMMVGFAVLFVVVIGWQIGLVIQSRARIVGDSQTLSSYGYDLSNLSVDRGKLHPIAVKGAQPAMENPAFLSPAEARDRMYGNYVRKIVTSELVLGVAINGEAKAYPLRMLNWHEVINDTVGGVPVAVTWSPLTQSAAVFDRRVDDRTLRFGYSGLLYNGNLVMYDERDDPAGPSAGESLWSQLHMRAISGPLAGRALRLLPAELTDWRDWSEAHPNSGILQGLDRYSKRYKRASFSEGVDEGRLPVPVEPRPGADSRIPPLHHVLAVPVASLGDAAGDEAVRWRAYPITERAAPDIPADRPRVYARWFAWYAFHGETTEVVPPGSNGQ